MRADVFQAAKADARIGIDPYHRVHPFPEKGLRMGRQDATLALFRRYALGSPARLRGHHKGRFPVATGPAFFLSLPLDAGDLARGLNGPQH